MPRFTGQNKKRIDPRYFLNETTDRDKETFDSKGYDKETGVYGPRDAEEYNTGAASDKIIKKKIAAKKESKEPELEEVSEKGGSQGDEFEKDRKAAREKRNKEEQERGAEEGRRNFAAASKAQKAAQKAKKNKKKPYSPEGQAAYDRLTALRKAGKGGVYEGKPGAKVQKA